MGGHKQRNLLFWAAFVFLFLNTVSLFAQTVRSDEYAGSFLARYVTTFLNRGRGNFPSDEANAVLQTRDGYMWFGGYNGLYRYDGTRFTIWNAVSPNGFGSSNIRALYEDTEGTLWIGTNDKGLVAYKDGTFKVFDRTLGLPSNIIRDIAESADGRIYCGTPDGIFSIDLEGNVALLSLGTPIQQAVISLCFDKDNNLYAVLNSGELFVHTSGPNSVTYRHPHPLPFYAVGRVSNGRIIAGTRRGDVLVLQFDTAKGIFSRSDVMVTPLRTIESIYEDSNGYIWLTAETGVGFLDNTENYRHVGDPSGVGFYKAIWEDYQNGYWIAATSGGITKLTVNTFTNFNALHNIETGAANAFLMDGDDIYIGTNNGMFALNKDGAPIHQNLTGMVTDRVRGISRDSRGNIWICTYSNLGVIRYTPSTNTIKYWTPADGIDTDRMRYAYELPNGVMAIGTAVGINFIKDDDVISVNEALETDAFIELPDIMVLSITVSADGTLYLGTDGNGVYAINKEGTTRYREEDGLSGGVVMRMHANPNDNGVWVSASPGLCYIDGNQKTVRFIEKIPPYTFLDIMQYKDELVLLTSEMIMHTNADNLLDPDYPFTYTAAGQASGLTGQINANSWNLITNNGDLYFCITTGVSIYSFETSGEHIVPYAGIAKILIDGVEYTDFRGGVNIPRDADRITFELSLLSFGLLDDTVLCYMLIGQDSEPVTLHKNDSQDISYTNLRGGAYTLQVWTEDISGRPGNFIEVNLHKDMQLLEYTSVWVIIAFLIAAITALLVWAIARLRIRQLAEKQELKLEMVVARLEKEKAEASVRSKNDFIAVISHEIRTPLNAVLGLAEIQMQKDNLPEEYSDTFTKIHASGSSLLGIINDILDMSRIESGKLELNPAEYDLPSFINDTAQLNIVRIASKPIEFILNVNENLPSRLIGDELRLKQILNNLLTNAIKYTEKGYVKLSIEADYIKNTGDVALCFTVADSGQGMKSEDMDKLFSAYSRFNIEANRTTEGTGLGLNITKKLVEMMDGTINAESEYGKGSTFTVKVRQKAVECTPIGSELAEQLHNFTFKGFVNVSDLHINHEPMPYGKVLIVDDVETNLYVAEGLLAPYKLTIETAKSGFTAIEKIKSGQLYDIIFMDHMMPQMDGVETTQKLRGLGYKGAIIALTANAIYGQSEVLMQNGFDGFISKPIDTMQLDSVLKQWIVKEKREEINDIERNEIKEQERQQQNSVISIPGIDIRHGIKMTGGTEAYYLKVLEIFCKDAKERLLILQTAPSADNLKQFITQVHSIKSAAASLGAHSISAQAAALEKAGREENIAFIQEKLSVFTEQLSQLIDNITAFLNSNQQKSESKETAADGNLYSSLLTELAHALESENAAEVDRILEELSQKQLDSKTREVLNKVSDELLAAEYGKALEIILKANG